MGRKSRSKNFGKHQKPRKLKQRHPLTASNDDEETANQIVSMCRQYMANFKPLTELKDENRKLKRPIIPSGVSTLMERYVKPTIYSETMAKIRDIIAGHKLYMSLAFSCNGHCYCCSMSDHVQMINVAVGVLRPDRPGEVFIINSVPDEISQSDESQHFDIGHNLLFDSLELLWPGDVTSHLPDILLLISEIDMARACLGLAFELPNILQVTCLDGIIENIIESCPCNHPKAQKVAALVTSYIENYTCGEHPYGTLEQFQAEVSLPQPLPSKLTISNFLEISIYIFNYIDLFKKYFLDHCNLDISSPQLLEAICNPENRREMAMLKVKYFPLLTAKRILQSRHVPLLVQSVAVIEEFRTKFGKWPDEEDLSEKFESLFTRNYGYLRLLKYSQLMSATSIEKKNVMARKLGELERRDENLELFRYAPLTTQDQYHFPNFTLLKEISSRVPVTCLYMISTIYSYIEETNQNERLYANLRQRNFCHENVDIAFIDAN